MSPIRPGDRIFDGKYEVLSLIGQGGFGEVWKLRYIPTGGLRALKIISPRFAQNDPTLVGRFEREILAMEHIDDEHVVKLYECGRIGESPCLVMEYVEGQTLRQLLADPASPKTTRPLPLDLVARLLNQLCGVLRVTHDRGIIHRDLKPENLMLKAGREPGDEFLKVLDFGIAKICHQEASDSALPSLSLTMAGAEPPCTPAYASPEQAMGRRIDHRSDLYSVGIILYELLTGRRPFEGNAYALLFAQENSPAPSFAEANPGVSYPPAIEEVVRRCLEKKPEQRYQSARELWKAFQQAASPVVGPIDSLITPYPRPVLVPPPRPGWVRRLVKIGGTTACIGLVVFLVLWQSGGFGERDRTIPWPPSAVREAIEKEGFDLAGSRPSARWPDWPELIQERPNGKRFALVGEGRYLPEGYRVLDEADAGDGWPKAIERMLTYDSNKGVVFRRIPGGTFILGSKEEREALPPEEVTLEGFYLQEHEVTNGEMIDYYARNKAQGDTYWKAAFDRLVGDLQGEPNTALAKAEALHHPAVNLSWEKARYYALDQAGDLPLEAQWEYAARSRGQDRPYVWGDKGFDGTRRQANLENVIGVPGTSPIKAFPEDQTDQEIWDMAGNVREWCRDTYEQDWHIIRGGSWRTYPEEAKCVFRHKEEAIGERRGRDVDLGFRLVIEGHAFPVARSAP